MPTQTEAPSRADILDRTKALERARIYEAEQAQHIPAGDRPAFHLTPLVGWANDPNGFCYYQGEYHLFYQYHPYNTLWGPMHWGHAASKDLLHWRWLPAALAPDSEQDESGCFSGSAVELDDGRLELLYTGVIPAEEPGKVYQIQCAAIGDGLDFEKHPENPVISAELLPEHSCPYDFRDPKIWREPDGSYACVAATCDETRDGRILLFKSGDAIHWRYVTTLDAGGGQYGKMWECPDFFPLDGKQVLLVSPQEVKPVLGSALHSGENALVLIGDYDETGDVPKFTRQSVTAVDFGLNFYAPQSVQAPDGRRIIIGWMESWETAQKMPCDHLWRGQMSTPRELRIKNGKLTQTPIRELQACYANTVAANGVTADGEKKLDGVQGRLLDLSVVLDVANSPDCKRFVVRVAQDESYATLIRYDTVQQIVTFDRTYSATSRDIAHIRQVHAAPEDGKLTLRVILDRYSAELFINDGVKVITATIETPQTATGVSFCADGPAHFDVLKHELVL